MKYNVKMHNCIIKEFDTKQEASQFAFRFLMTQQLYANQLDYINEAVEKSDLKEANEIIKHIKELS